jgi:hypothetical protein
MAAVPASIAAARPFKVRYSSQRKVGGHSRGRRYLLRDEEATANAVLTTAMDTWDDRGHQGAPARRLACSDGLWWTRVDPEILLTIGSQPPEAPRPRLPPSACCAIWIRSVQLGKGVDEGRRQKPSLTRSDVVVRRSGVTVVGVTRPVRHAAGIPEFGYLVRREGKPCVASSRYLRPW